MGLLPYEEKRASVTSGQRRCVSCLGAALLALTACDIPVPVTVMDGFALDVDEAIGRVDLDVIDPPICLPQSALRSGAPCEECPGLSEEVCRVTHLRHVGDAWPGEEECKPLIEDGCPQLDEEFSFTAFMAIDESENEQLQTAERYVDDVLINRLVFDYQSNSTVRGLPEITLWVGPYVESAGQGAEGRPYSDDLGSEEFQAEMSEKGFMVLGVVPEQPPSATGMVDVSFVPEGKIELRRLLFDGALTLVARGEGRIDTRADPTVPRGTANLRLTLRVTFFLSAA